MEVICAEDLLLGILIGLGVVRLLTPIGTNCTGVRFHKLESDDQGRKHWHLECESFRYRYGFNEVFTWEGKRIE